MKYKKRAILITLLFITISSVFFSGCGTNSHQDNIADAVNSENQSMKIDATSASYSTKAKDTSSYSYNQNVPIENVTTSSSPEIHKQMIIYNGSFHIIVKDLKDASSQIKQKVRESQGYLVNSNSSENSKGYYAHYEFKIPAKGFESLVDEINNMELGTITINNVNSQDVTKEYYDLDARLNAKKIYEQRLLSFLEKADKTEDLLRISNDLNRVEEDIDRIKGQLDYYKYHADFSTLIIDLEQSRDNVVPNATAWEKSTNGFHKSIDDIIQFFTAIFVWLISYFPILILLIILIFIVLKVKDSNYIKNKRLKKSSQQIEGSENEDSNEK